MSLKKYLIGTLASIYSLFFTALVHAAPAVEISSDSIRVDLAPYVDLLEDKQGNITIDEIYSNKYTNQFTPLPLTALFFGYTNSVYWLRFSADNKLEHEKRLVLEVTPADIDYIDVYGLSAREHKKIFHKRSGSAVDISERDYNHPLYFFDLSIPAKTQHIFYIRLESNKNINAELRLSSPNEHFFYSSIRDGAHVFLLSTLLLLGIIHIGMASVFKYKGFVYCGFMMLTMGFIQACWDGYFIQFFKADANLLDRQLMLSVYLSNVFMLLFTRCYLSTHERMPLSHRVLTGFIVISLMGIPCSWLFDSGFNALLVGLVSLPAIFFALGVAGYSFMEGYEPARYFVLARTLSLFATLITVFADQGLLPQGFLGAWGVSAATVIEGSIFLFVMTVQQSRKQKAAQVISRAMPIVEMQPMVPLSVFCHELRTPIGGVIGMTDLLLDTPLTDQQRLQALAIHRSGKSLLDVVNKMSDLSALETGESKLLEVSFEILAVVESCIESARDVSERRNIELIYRVDESLAGFFRGDEDKLQQIVNNLISFGMRHLESGEILLTARQEGQDQVLFEVMSGKNTLTEDYTAVNQSKLSPTSADNLNLTLARKFVGLLGGELLIRSRSDGGIKSSFKILLRHTQRKNSPEESEWILRGKRLMVVDDNETCCKIIQQQATHWGMDVITAGGAREALALLGSQANSNGAFNLMLVDYEMPVMNGIELVKKIRQDQDMLQTQNTLVMILTGVSRMPAQLMDEQLKIHRVLYKPLSGKSLKLALIDAFQLVSSTTRII